MGSSIIYKGRYFIRDAYTSVFGITANRIFGAGGGLTLSKEFTTKLTTVITKEINRSINR